MSSELVAAGGKVVQNSSSSSTFSSSSSSSISASSSSSTKVVKSSTTSSSQSVSSSSSSSSSKSSSISIKSSGKSFKDQLALDLGLDVSKEMEKLKLRMDEEMSNIHRDVFRLMPITPPLALTSGAAPSLDDTLVRLDADAVRSCVDKTNADKMKLNFDVHEFESESISVKTVGNKIEVHAQKKSKKGDEERSEEFSRVYELPTASTVDPSHVTSSIFQDGVLTIELPVAEALPAV